MAKASEPQKDEEALRQIGERLKQQGVKLSEKQSEMAAPTPKPERDSFEQRAKVKDLSQDQGKKPEGVHQQTSWADRVIASRPEPGQGMSRGGTSSEPKSRVASPEQTNRAANDNTAKTSSPTSWADRVIASRPAGYGHGKVDGQEAAQEKGKGQEAKKEAPKEPQKETKAREARPQAAARGQDKGQENER